MKRLAIILWAVLFVGGSVPTQITAQAPGALQVLPESGKFVGIVRSDKVGRWWVYDQEMMPVQFTTVPLPPNADGTSSGTICYVHAPAGKYGVMFIPTNDSDPIQGSKLVLGGGDSPDPPPDPDQEGPWQIAMFYDGSMLDNYPRGQQEILNSVLLREWLKEKGHVLLEVRDLPQLEEVSSVMAPFVAAAKKIPTPSIVIAPKAGGKVAAHALPETLVDFKKFLQQTQRR